MALSAYTFGPSAFLVKSDHSADTDTGPDHPGTPASCVGVHTGLSAWHDLAGTDGRHNHARNSAGAPNDH
ncbi:hypothetical protein IU469_30845 [Nocardia puris]|uniref:hypothetical protein n=1 Tax=Nocardia puris TaxID=208602 RepID=UPI001895C9E1|nr:hypothetical protein [Nocardia puris]MBF6213143.1 hypothetical protein [Nocardia puris]MBF6370072.1 hypothetical protein [Nocardia puris]